MQWICTGILRFNILSKYFIYNFIRSLMLLKCTLLYFSLREMFKDIAFVYISDDLGWGKQKLEKKARLRNFDLYFVGDSSKSENRDRDRDRWDIIHCENFLHMIQYASLFIMYLKDFKLILVSVTIWH